MTAETRGVLRAPGLADQVYEIVFSQIMSGELPPGEPIIIERLAAALDVSATPVREALARFVQEGFIIRLPNGRLQLAPLTKEYVLDSYYVRGALESLAAELAATRISASRLRTLRRVVEAAESALRQGRHAEYAEANVTFHRTIIAAANNAILQRELPLLELHTGYILQFTKRTVHRFVEELCHEHTAIFDAIQQRAPKPAHRAMERHIRRSGTRSLEVLGFS